LVISGVAGYFSLTTEFAQAETANVNLSDSSSLSFQDEIPWQPFSEQAVQDLQGKPLFIDFTADWCLTCKVNEKTILETQIIREAMDEHGIIPLKADWTRRDEDITQWLKKFGKAGVPFYLVISKDGTSIPLPEVITTDMVIEALKKGAS
jgi:thiol:disulfide interchange protein DsbD